MADGVAGRDPGLAPERTELAWSRTALAVVSLGAVALRGNVVVGLVIIGAAGVLWRLRHTTRSPRLVTIVTCAVAGLALALAILMPPPD